VKTDRQPVILLRGPSQICNLTVGFVFK